jgi:HAD superfamily hydrolase (TIGR01490 family)
MAMKPAESSAPISTSASSAKHGAVRAAYFDVDGTLTATNIVMPLYWYKSRLCSAPAAFFWKLSLALRGPYWFILDRIDRAASNRAIYSNYAGMNAAEAKRLAQDYYRAELKPRIMPAALERVMALKRDDVSIVIITGGLDFVMQPLADELGAALVAPALADDGSIFTGAISTGAISGARKAQAVAEHASKHGVDLTASFAFGDSYEGDFAMLDAVGHPCAVSPDRRLARIAAARGWAVERWRK